MGIFDALGGGAAAAGGALGGPVGAGLAGAGALIGGFLGGGKPKIPKELKRLYQMQLDESRRLQQYSRGIPLADPQEQAALASQRGAYGEQARAGAANAGAAYNMNLGMQGLPDFLQGLQAQQQGGLQQIQSGALQQSLLARQQAGPQAAQLAAGAVGAAQYQQQPDLSAAFGSLARLIGYNQTLRANPPAPRTQNTLAGAPGIGPPPVGEPPPGPTSRGAGSTSAGEEAVRAAAIQGTPVFGRPVTPMGQAPTAQYGTASNPQQLLNTSLRR